jgi:hypothetical protein
VSQLDAGPNNHEDWEDWLRWDPAAEPTSPDDTFNSGSSKNDSPIQDPAFLAPFGQNNDEGGIPPLIVGDDNFGFATGGTDLGQDSFLFGGVGDFNAGFDFPQPSPLDTFSNVPKLDSNTAAWPLPSNDDQDHDISLPSIDDLNSQLNIAASLTATTPSLLHSPESTTNTRQSISSNSPDPPKKREWRFAGWRRTTDEEDVA